MKVKSIARGLAAAALAMIAGIGIALSPSSALAHNGVRLEQDECILQIGSSSVHFSAYQRIGEEQEFCEDISNIGPTVLGLTAVSPELRDMAIGIRVIKDVSAESAGGLDAITVAFREPKVYHNGTMTFEHDFKDAGHYVGIVTVRDDLGNEWTARFPFKVGLYTFWGMIEYILYAVGFMSLCGLLWFVIRVRSRRAIGEPRPAV